MEKKEIIQQLVQLEQTSSNDFELGGLVREFIRKNFIEIYGVNTKQVEQ